jgi:hypothetical protein
VSRATVLAVRVAVSLVITLFGCLLFDQLVRG